MDVQPKLTVRSLAAVLSGAILLPITAGLFAAATEDVQAAVSSQAGLSAGNQGRQLNLRDQLRLGLKATTKQDLEFIDSAVLAVRQGKLPRRVVDSTFLWARQRAHLNVNRVQRRRLRPMIYFQPGLTLRASRLGLQL